MWLTTLVVHALFLADTALSSPLDPPSQDQLRSPAPLGPWGHGGPILPATTPSSTAARARSVELPSRGPGAKNGPAASLASGAPPSPPSVLHLPRQTTSPTLPVLRGLPPAEALVPIPFPSLDSAAVTGTGNANMTNSNNTLPQPKPLAPHRPSHGAIPTVRVHVHDAHADRADGPLLPTPALAGCVTTTIGPLANPCATDGVLTVHTSTRTLFRSVNCHGCTSVHVIAPMWGCPLLSAAGGVATTTPATPFTWTSTVCESLTEVGELTGTTTETASGLVTVTVTVTGRPPGGSSAASVATGGPRLVTTVVTSVVRETEVFTTTERVWPAGSMDALLPFSVSS